MNLDWQKDHLIKLDNESIAVLNMIANMPHFDKLFRGVLLQDFQPFKYDSEEGTFLVFDSDVIKIVTNLKDYYYGFDKRTGFTVRYGEKVEDDPTWCPIGPEILDLEISVNGCPKVGGHNCKFCYKNNSDAPASNMTFDEFKTIVTSFARNLSQIAFGITGVQTNPDFPRMLAYCREIGIIPNYTLSGADLNDQIIDATKDCCGAIAVSCYEGNKDLCYNTIAKFHEKAPNVHVNMHIVLSEGTLNHVMDVLNDLKKTREVERSLVKGKFIIKMKDKVPQDPRLEFLRHVVFLRIKPVGRATNLNTKVPLSIFKQVVDFCTENNIGYGFDSCSAPDVEKVLISEGKGNLSTYCESCESGKFSIYISKNGLMTPCSFCEHMFGSEAIDMLHLNDEFYKIWYNNELLKKFRGMSREDKRCPIYDLTAKE